LNSCTKFPTEEKEKILQSVEAEFEKYENQWQVSPESASLKLKNLFNITSLKTEFEKYENQWQVSPKSASLKHMLGK